MGRKNKCCLVPYCTSETSTDGKERYFSIPKTKVGPVCEVTKELSRKRRSLWLQVLGLTEADTEGQERILVCSRHFVSGQPEYEMYENGVDWVPSLNIPVPEIIPIPPPTQEHSYCQTSAPTTAYNWRKAVSDQNKLMTQRCSNRLLKKKRAIEKAKAQRQKADAIAEKIRAINLKKERRLNLNLNRAIKKAKREEKIKRAENEADIFRNRKMVLLNQIESMDIPITSRSNILPSNEDLHKLPNDTSEASKGSDALRSDSTRNNKVNDMLNKFVPSISQNLINSQLIHMNTKPSAQKQHHIDTNLEDAVCTDTVNTLPTSALKNEFLQQLALSQIDPNSGKKSAPVRILPKRTAEPNIVKLPSKILILRKDASDKTSRTVITLKSSVNASCHTEQNNVAKMIKQIQTHPSSSTTVQQQSIILKNSSPAVVFSTKPILTKTSPKPLNMIQPAAKAFPTRKGVAAKTPPTIATPMQSSVNLPYRAKNAKPVEVRNCGEVMKPAHQNELVFQNLRSVETYIRELMSKKNATAQDTYLSSLLQKLIDRHRMKILDTTQLVPSTRIRQGHNDKEIVDLTKNDDSDEYILPDALPKKMCPTSNCRNSVEEITFLKSQLEKKSVELDSCRSDLDNLKEKLCEAKEYINSLSAQLNENTQTLCSYLANNPHEIQK